MLGWFQFGGPSSGFWQVRVKSDANKCQKERNVKLYSEANGLVGSGMTEKQGDGRWIWEDFEFEPMSGEYFAVAPLTNRCKSAVSKTFTYPDDN